MSATQKAYEKLKNYVIFSPNFETFKGLFWENLDKEQTDLAIELLLRVVYKILTSEGEKLNEILNTVDDTAKKQLEDWLKQTYERKVKNV